MSVIRFDKGSLRRPQRTAQGFLRVDARLSRAGIFEYRNPDGTVRRELRDPTVVFDAAALDSFAMAPVTDDHPPVMLTADNAREHTRGHAGDVRRDGDFLVAPLLITDAALIAKMEAGKREVSCGYVCDMDDTPGEWNGQKYDARQMNVRGNHVAIVAVGRAGRDVCVKMDAAEQIDTGNWPEEKSMKKIRLDGIDFEVSPEAAQAVEKTLGALKADADKAQARADAADAKVAALEAQAKTDAEAFPARVRARIALEKTAGDILGGDVKLDTLSDLEVKAAVVEKASGVKTAGKSDAYIDAAYDIAIASKVKADADAAAGALGAARSVVDAAGTKDVVRKDVAAHAAMLGKVKALGLAPIPGAVSK